MFLHSDGAAACAVETGYCSMPKISSARWSIVVAADPQTMKVATYTVFYGSASVFQYGVNIASGLTRSAALRCKPCRNGEDHCARLSAARYLYYLEEDAVYESFAVSVGLDVVAGKVDTSHP